MTPYASLFSSIELAGRRLRNRIVHPSMTTVTGADGRATDRLIQYHLNRARGGAAMLITEPRHHHSSERERTEGIKGKAPKRAEGIKQNAPD